MRLLCLHSGEAVRILPPRRVFLIEIVFFLSKGRVRGATGILLIVNVLYTTTDFSIPGTTASTIRLLGQAGGQLFCIRRLGRTTSGKKRKTQGSAEIIYQAGTLRKTLLPPNSRGGQRATSTIHI